MNNQDERQTRPIDWSLTSWEGARREQLRRWSQLPLERIIAAIEEMAETSRHLAEAGERQRGASSVMESKETDYGKTDKDRE